MKDKDFIFDFYMGDDDAKDTSSSVPQNELPQEVESEILLSSFSDEEIDTDAKKQRTFAKFKVWWQNRKKWQKAVIISALAFFLVLSIVTGVLYSGIGYNYNKITSDHEDLGIDNIIDKDIVNVALFGIDTRSLKSFKGNSDSIMILSLNTKTKKVKIISIMRDSFVPITYNGITTYNKINSAYAKGGPELAIKVINSNFGLDITEYATVNFFGMVDIIDAVGGIDAELTKGEVASISANPHAINATISEICNSLNVSAKENYITTPGKHHLNGIQAVGYSRLRYVANIWGTNNDYGRTDRQRYVMEQLFNKALTIEKSQYMKLVKSLIPCSETSLSYREIIGLAFDILLESPSFEQARIPRNDMTMLAPKTNAGSVVYYDLAFAKKLIHSFIYDDIDFDKYVEENGIEKNDWYTEAILNRKPSGNNSGNKNNSSASKKPSKDNADKDKDDSGVSNIKDSSDDTTTSIGDGTTGDNPTESDGNSSSNISDTQGSSGSDKGENSNSELVSSNQSDGNETDSSNQNTDSSDKNNSGSSEDNSSNQSGDSTSSDKNNSGTSQAPEDKNPSSSEAASSGNKTSSRIRK